MPPRKQQPKPILPDFQPPDEKFEFNKGFRYGMSDNPPLLGQKAIPEGKPGCLEGITFTATGTMPSLRREDLKDLVEKYGGRLTSSISGKTDVLIRGVIEVGPSKLQDAKKRGLKIIDEDSLFHYLESTNPDAKPKVIPTIKGGTELPTSLFPITSLLTEKYRPRLLKDVIGNLGPIKHMIEFLENYSPDDDKKCIILSGPPGIGKSTCASLVSLYCGYTPKEYNASDTRSKIVLKSTMGELFTNKLLVAKKEDKADELLSAKICIIMDEVDGMSTGDRGGLQELVKYVDKSVNPVICICNDRDNKKFTTLAKRSVDIKFSPPPAAQIQARLATIAKEEGISIKEESLQEIAQNCGGDIRLAINMLQFWSKKETGDMKSDIQSSAKNVTLTDPVDAAQKLLRSDTTLEERFDCYFIDYGLVPLYLEQNLQNNTSDECYADALESIAIGDVVSTEVATNSQYSLLTAAGFFSTVLPSIQSPGKEWGGMVTFPLYWGKLSRGNKLKRYIQEISAKLSRTSNASSSQIYDSTLPLLFTYAKKTLGGRKGNPQALLDLLDSLELTIDDYEHMCEVVLFCTPGDLSRKMPGTPSVKSNLKRGYNERHTNASGIVGHLDVVREDYYITSKPDFIPSSKPTTKRAKATKRVFEDSIEINDDANGDESSSTEEEAPKKRGGGRGGRARGGSGRGRSRGRGGSRRRASDDYSDEDMDKPTAEDKAFIADDDEDTDAAPELSDTSSSEGEISEDDDDDDEELELSDDDDEKKKKKKKQQPKKQAPKSKILKKHKGKKSKKGL